MSTGVPFEHQHGSPQALERRSVPTPVLPHGPGIRVPAPFYFAAALLLAWPLHLLWPLRIVNGPVADVAGATLSLVVAALSAFSVRALWQELQRDLMKKLDLVTLDELCSRANQAGVNSEGRDRLDFSI